MRNSRRFAAIFIFAFLVSGILLARVLADRAPTAPGKSTGTPTLSVVPSPPDREGAEAQKKQAADDDKFVFLHKDHEGEQKALDEKTLIKLDCNYCHLAGPEEKLTAGFGKFPCDRPDVLAKMGKVKKILHSACTACHGNIAIIARNNPQFCLICHTKPGFTPKLPVKPFPSRDNPSQFSLNFPHRSHQKKVLFALLEPAHATGVEIASLKPIPAALVQAKPATGQNMACTACHNIEVAGVYASKPQHRSCFVCHSEQVAPMYKDVQSEPYATDCAGCHPKARTNPFKDAPNTTSFKIVNLMETDKDGKVVGGPLFRHSGDHSVMAKISETGQPLACVTCHGAVRNEPSRTKVKTDDARKRFLISPYPESCGGCHTLKRRPLVGFISKKQGLGNIFAVSNCDRCHTQDIIDKDADYHKKQLQQQTQPQTPPKTE